MKTVTQLPQKPMTPMQLTIAVNNLSRAVKRIQEVNILVALENHEHLLSQHANQMKELILSHRVYRNLFLANGQTEEGLSILKNAERVKFEAEIKDYKIMHLTNEIAATEKSLVDAKGTHIRGTLEGHLSALRTQLNHLNGDADHGTISSEEGCSGHQAGEGADKEEAGPETRSTGGCESGSHETGLGAEGA